MNVCDSCNNVWVDYIAVYVREIQDSDEFVLAHLHSSIAGVSDVNMCVSCNDLWSGYMAVYVREIQDSDQFVYLHLKRRRPRWKCGPIK